MEVSVGIEKHNSTGTACKGTKPFGGCAVRIANAAVGYAKFFSRLHDTVIRVFDVDSASQRSGDPRFETIVAYTIGFCLIRQSSADPIAMPRRTRIGLANAHNSVRYFNRPVDRSVTNLAVQFRLGILPKRRSRPGSRDIVDLRADGTCLAEYPKSLRHSRSPLGDSCLVRRHIQDFACKRSILRIVLRAPQKKPRNLKRRRLKAS
jgi:hypothetical protein